MAEVHADCMRRTSETAIEPDHEKRTARPELGNARLNLGKLVALIDDGTISGKIAKTIFQKMVESDDDPHAIVEREGLVQVTDESAIAAVVDRVVAANPDKVAEFKAGRL